MRQLTYTVILLLLSGCVGFVTSTTDEVKYKKPGIKRMGVGYYVTEKDAEDNTALSRSNVVNTFGQPARSKVTGEQEILHYEDDNNWCGIVPMLIIPIPLVLPVCESYKEFIIENEVVIEATVKSADVNGFYCGPLVGMNKNWNTGNNSTFCVNE